MKAFLLAAGQGTRLRPLTETIPKCLVPINGVPLLEIWIRQLESAGTDHILINTHYLADQVEAEVDRLRREIVTKITTVYEADLLGSGGTVWANRDFVAGEDDFFIVYADNLTDLDLRELAGFHQTCRKRGGLLTMGLFRAPDPRACGIAALDLEGKIVNFMEKPRVPAGNLANSGIYVASQDIFSRFPDDIAGSAGTVLDFGHHILPRLIGNMYGYVIPGYLRDIGTPESYRAAQQEWPPER